jgi:hypothetical protein
VQKNTPDVCRTYLNSLIWDLSIQPCENEPVLVLSEKLQHVVVSRRRSANHTAITTCSVCVMIEGKTRTHPSFRS